MGGGGRWRDVRRYDFHQPDAQQGTSAHVAHDHENMARRLGLQLSSKMRTSVDVIFHHRHRPLWHLYSADLRCAQAPCT